MTLFQRSGNQVKTIRFGVSVPVCTCERHEDAERITRLLNEEAEREERSGGWVWVLVGFIACAVVMFAALVWTEVI